MKLAEYLEKNGLKQGWFAKQLGVDPSTVSLWKCGKLTPPLPHRKLISMFTKGDVSEEDWDVKVKK